MTLTLFGYKKFLLVFAALLPLQLTLRLVLHLPSYLMLIYIFIFAITIYFFLLPKQQKKISKIQFIVSIILLLFFTEIVISVMYNYPDIIGKSVPFEYYVRKYSKFWDSALISSIFAGVIRPAIYFLFCFFLFFILKKEVDLKFLCKILVIIGFISSLYSIYQFIAFYFNLPFSALFSGHDGNDIVALGIRRVEGILYEPGPQATFLSVIFCLLLFQQDFTKRSNKFFKNIFLEKFSLFTITITLFLTLSPIGILTPFITMPFYLLFLGKQRLLKVKKFIFTLFFIIILLLGVQIKNDSFSYVKYTIDRITNLQSNKAIIWGDHRSVRNEIALKLIKEKPLLGVGAGNDGFYYAKLAPYAVGYLPDKGIVINNNLKIWSDSGLLGFILYLLLLILPYYYWWKLKLYKQRNNVFLYNLSYSLLVSVFLFVILTFNSQVEFFQPLFWLVYALLFSSITLLVKQKHRDFKIANNIRV